jgi:uncharacterized membrane protein
MLYNLQVTEWQTQIKEDINDYNNIKKYLHDLQAPYIELLDFDAERKEKIGMSLEDIEKEQMAMEGFKKSCPTLHKFEKYIIDRVVDRYSNAFVRKMGYKKANWLPCTKVLMICMFILNAFACYARPDFLT